VDLDHQYCTFYLGGHHFAIEVLGVQEVFRLQEITHVPLAPGVLEGLINLRGRIITAINLHELLAIPIDEDKRPSTCIVTRTDEGSVCLLVDQIGDVLTPSAHAFESPPDTLDPGIRRLVRQVCKLENNLLLILDTEAAVGGATV